MTANNNFNHTEASALAEYKRACELFAHNSNVSNALYVDECAERLVSLFGYTWDQLEEV